MGLFVAGGFAIFILAIFIIGKQKHMFSPVIRLYANFRNISGLQVGNNVRFSGINVGTVDNIDIVNDTTVRVILMVESHVQRFIKTDCEAGIASEGIVGDRLVMISHGSSEAPTVINGSTLRSREPVETDDIIASIKISAENAEIISGELAEIMFKINNGEGVIGKFIDDSAFAQSLNETLENLRRGSKSLDENMEAAKHNILLRGYFNKKKKEAQKQKEEAEKKEEEKRKQEEKK